MKFLPLADFDIVTSALNFDTPDCHITGGCELFTTKAAGTDKKLYKTIDKSLQSQHAALLKLGASLSPPQRQEMAATHNLSRSSPFGNLGHVGSRRTFAYLIATLNAAHPDYDFSHVLRPADFRRERSLRAIMSNLDSTLSNIRPSSMVRDGSAPRSFGAAGRSDGGAAGDIGVLTTPLWGPQMWAMIDKEMTLKDCTMFSYQPADDPFDEEDGAIWALHYLFFNKTLKRVTYLYVRGMPVVSYSPRLSPRLGWDRSSHAKRRGLSMDLSTNKRARYWLDDEDAERVPSSDDDEFDDGMLWNRGAGGDFEVYPPYDDDESQEDVYASQEEDVDGDNDETDDEQRKKGPVRGVSEDIAARMEIED